MVTKSRYERIIEGMEEDGQNPPLSYTQAKNLALGIILGYAIVAVVLLIVLF